MPWPKGTRALVLHNAKARQGEQDFQRRQRRVEEKPHGLLAALLAQFSGQRDQVIVMHPDDIRYDEPHRP